MRTIRIVVAAAGLALGLAACTSNGSIGGSVVPNASGSAGPSSGASTGASSGASSAAGVANQCVVGTWKATGVNAALNAAGAQGSVSGGGGLLVTVAADGATTVDFAGMQPVAFNATGGGTDVKGQFTYGGKVTGAVQVPATATTTGVWKPAGATDWHALTVTVDMTSPVNGRIFDHVKIADFATAGSGQTGGSVDLQPILREAAYECSGNTLKLGPPPGTTGPTWVLERA